MATGQVLQTTLTVVIPAEDRRKCKEHETDHQDKCRYLCRDRKTVLKCIGRDLHTLESLYLPCAGQHDGKSGQSTDDNRINKCTGHAHKSLTHRLLALCRCCRNRSTSKACLVGENTTRNTLLHRNNHAADHTTGHSLRVKRTLYDHYNRCRNLPNIKQDQADAEHEINDCHKRYNDLADRRDSLQSSDQDQRNTKRQNQGRNHNRPGI